LKSFLSITWKVLRSLVLGILLLAVLGHWAMRTAWFQEWIKAPLENVLTSALGADVQIGSLDIDLPAKLVLRNTTLLDEQDQTLFGISELRTDMVDLPLWKMLLRPSQPADITIEHLDILGPVANLYKRRQDSTLNLDFLTASEDTSASKPIALNVLLRQGRIRDGQFRYVDSTQSDVVLLQEDRFNASNLQVDAISMDFNLDMQGNPLELEGKIETLTARESRSGQTLKEFHAGYYAEIGPQAPGGLLVCLDDARLLLTDRTELFFNGDFVNAKIDSTLEGSEGKFAINFLHSQVHMDDLQAFSAKPLPVSGPAQFYGYLYGDLNHAYSDDFAIGIFDTTKVRTSLVVNDLQDPDQLNFELNLAPSQVSFHELSQFLPTTELPLAGVASLDGEVTGSLNHIASKDIHIRYADFTDLHVRTRIFDYADAKNLHMDLKLVDSKVDMKEIRRLLPGVSLPAELDGIGRTQVNGSYVGGQRDFVVDALLGTQYGNADVNMHFLLPRNGDMAYDGEIKTSGMNLDALQLASSPLSSNLNFDGSVKGRGLDFRSMEAEFKGRFTDSDFAGYQIDLVETQNMVVKQSSIFGDIEVKDGQGDGSVNLEVILPKDSMHYVDIRGDVSRLDLDHYGLLPGDSILLTSILVVDLEGDSLENYAGKLRFFNNTLERDGVDTLRLRAISLKSLFFDDGQHDIQLKSKVANMRLTGDFLYSDITRVASRISKELNLYIRNNDSLTTEYYNNKVHIDHHLSIKDTLTTGRELNDLFDFLRIPVYAANQTRILADLDHGEIDQVRLRMISDSLNFATVGLMQDSMDMELIKDGHLNQLILTGHLESKRFWPTDFIKVENFVLQPQGDDRELYVHAHGTQSEYDNFYLVNLKSLFLPNDEISTQVLNGSRLKIRDNTWYFDRNNRITRKRGHAPSLKSTYPDSLIDRFLVDNLSLFLLDSVKVGNQFVLDTQRVRVDGIISQDAQDIVNATIEDVDIASMLKIAEQDLDFRGRIPKARFLGWKLLSDKPSMFAECDIEDFGYKAIDSMDISIIGSWPFFDLKDSTQTNPDYAWSRVVANGPFGDSLKTEGTYQISTDSLLFEFFPSALPLAYLEPFMAGEVSNIQGKLRLDSAKITGTTQQPRIDGDVHFSDAAMRVNFLNNTFFLGNNSLHFDNDTLAIPRITVSDTFGQSGVLYGKVDYNNAAGIFLQLKMDEIDNLTIMNTGREDSDDFYGRVVIQEGEASIEGLTDLIRVDATVSTGSPTQLNIPLDNYTSANQLEFVNFIGADKTIGVIEKTNYEGFSLLANVSATPDAEVRLILDEQVGDIIEGRGEGNITMKVSETGEFELFGTYLLSEGNYLFTAENIVNKKFIVQPGGRISFNGDPYNAELDLKAVYKVNADVSDLFNSSNSPRVPVEILMHMQGSLEEPKIGLSLQLDNLSQQDVMALSSYFRRIEYDEQELNKQVVSLLLFGKFSGTTSASSSSPVGGVTSSISELISNQVNYWISQAFSDANLGLEVNTNEFQDVELAIKTTLFNDKVTVERNGALISNQGNGTTLGDLSVQVKLLPREDSSGVARSSSGRLVLEIFNREDITLNSAANITRGAGIFYKKDFDQIGDLFRKRKAALPKESTPKGE